MGYDLFAWQESEAAKRGINEVIVDVLRLEKKIDRILKLLEDGKKIKTQTKE